VFALSIGLALAANGRGLGSFVGASAFLQLATDMYQLIPFGSLGSGGGPPWGGLPGRAFAAVASGGRSEAIKPAGATTQMSDSEVAQLYGY
jgi:hypothetical protein